MKNEIRVLFGASWGTNKVTNKVWNRHGQSEPMKKQNRNFKNWGTNKVTNKVWNRHGQSEPMKKQNRNFKNWKLALNFWKIQTNRACCSVGLESTSKYEIKQIKRIEWKNSNSTVSKAFHMLLA